MLARNSMQIRDMRRAVYAARKDIRNVVYAFDSYLEYVASNNGDAELNSIFSVSAAAAAAAEQRPTVSAALRAARTFFADYETFASAFTIFSDGLGRGNGRLQLDLLLLLSEPALDAALDPSATSHRVAAWIDSVLLPFLRQTPWRDDDAGAEATPTAEQQQIETLSWLVQLAPLNNLREKSIVLGMQNVEQFLIKVDGTGRAAASNVLLDANNMKISDVARLINGRDAILENSLGVLDFAVHFRHPELMVRFALSNGADISQYCYQLFTDIASDALQGGGYLYSVAMLLREAVQRARAAPNDAETGFDVLAARLAQTVRDATEYDNLQLLLLLLDVAVVGAPMLVAMLRLVFAPSKNIRKKDLFLYAAAPTAQDASQLKVRLLLDANASFPQIDSGFLFRAASAAMALERDGNLDAAMGLTRSIVEHALLVYGPETAVDLIAAQYRQSTTSAGNVVVSTSMYRLSTWLTANAFPVLQPWSVQLHKRIVALTFTLVDERAFADDDDDGDDDALGNGPSALTVRSLITFQQTDVLGFNYVRLLFMKAVLNRRADIVTVLQRDLGFEPDALLNGPQYRAAVALMGPLQTLIEPTAADNELVQLQAAGEAQPVSETQTLLVAAILAEAAAKRASRTMTCIEAAFNAAATEGQTVDDVAAQLKTAFFASLPRAKAPLLEFLVQLPNFQQNMPGLILDTLRAAVLREDLSLLAPVIALPVAQIGQKTAQVLVRLLLMAWMLNLGPSVAPTRVQRMFARDTVAFRKVLEYLGLTREELRQVATGAATWQ